MKRRALSTYRDPTPLSLTERIILRSRAPMPLIVLVSWLGLSSFASAQTAEVTTNGGAVVSATQSGDSIVVESKGGPISYKAVVEGKFGGNITQLCIPADGGVVARELNDIFFFGDHGDDYTLRGWTGRNRFVMSHSIEVTSQKPDEAVIQVDLVATGIIKIFAKDEAAKANIRKTHLNFKEKAIEIKRTMTFKPDRVLTSDELLWVNPETEMKTFYETSAYVPGAFQNPVLLTNGAISASFLVTTSSGRKVPPGLTYPFTAENFLKNGYKVSVRTTASSFDAGKSNLYFHEKPWQQDWHQVSGFMYELAGTPPHAPVKVSHEAVFSKAAASEMPPVVTIQSPPPDARWMDQPDEKPKHKIGDVLKLSAAAVNSDGSPVPDEDISWEVHIDPWWNTPPATLRGASHSYAIPDVTDEKDKTASSNRNMLAVISVTAKGKNGTVAVESYAMLVGKAEH